MAARFKCNHCGNFKEEGCGDPNRKVAVVYESGVIKMHPLPCPLEFASPFRRWMRAKLGWLLL